LKNGEINTAANGLDYSVVNSYWRKADASIMGPYMMDGFGFPASAGRFRFHAESAIVQQLIHNANVDTTEAVLDLGSGVGYWTEYFARKFKKVVAVEASTPLYESMAQRCSLYDHVTLLQGDVLSFEPEGRFSLIFLGGLLMYLNENDAITLLQKLKPFLTPDGIILCRESTVQNGTVTREGEYQAIYRSVQTYRSLFNRCGLTVAQTCLNVPYVLMQMGCEFIKAWKRYAPQDFQCLPFIGRTVYWGLRLGNPWITRIPLAMRIDFPELTNHFFLLRSDSSPHTRGNMSSVSR
jgi:protein-L-isoaspartate O-methyltransferase